MFEHVQSLDGSLLTLYSSWRAGTSPRGDLGIEQVCLTVVLCVCSRAYVFVSVPVVLCVG